MSICSHPHGHELGVHGVALQALLGQCEARCEAAGEKLTASRRRVLDLLLQAGGPVKAYDLMAAFGPEGETAKPPTVYRALEFLTRLGFAHRIESLNAFIACGLGERPHTAAFLVCDCCGAAREIEPPASLSMEPAAKAAGYRLSGVTVEAHGRCPDCADA